MKKLIVLAAVAAALSTSACVTVIDADNADNDDNINWSGQNAQPFDASLEACREYAGRNQNTPAFVACMAEKGWTRD